MEKAKPEKTEAKNELPIAWNPVELDSIESSQDLEALGLDHLKNELQRSGLKCGGTLAERASRLFSVKGLSPDQIDPALMAKPAAKKK